eukprot:6818571-Lingulodinium_polyedra.AAC.1
MTGSSSSTATWPAVEAPRLPRCEPLQRQTTSAAGDWPAAALGKHKERFWRERERECAEQADSDG